MVCFRVDSPLDDDPLAIVLLALTDSKSCFEKGYLKRLDTIKQFRFKIQNK